MLTTKTYAFITSAIFALVAVLHVVRIAAGWDLAISSWPVPMWVSVIGSIVPGMLAAEGLRIGRGANNV